MHVVNFQPERSDRGAGTFIRNSAVAGWFEKTISDYLDQLLAGESLDAPWSQSSMQVDFFRDFTAGQALKFEVSVSDVTQTAFSVGCRIYQNGELCSVGSCVLVQRDPESRCNLPLKESVARRLESEVLSFHRMGQVAAN